MKDYFSDVANHYERLAHGHPIKKWYLSRKNNQLGRILHGFDGIALDAGCGTGYYRKILPEARFVLGVDLSESMLQQGMRLRGDKIHFIRGDCLQLPIQSESLDLVLCLGVLAELNSWEERRLLVNEIIRVLRPAGSFIIDFPRRTILKVLSIILWRTKSKLFFHSIKELPSLQLKNYAKLKKYLSEMAADLPIVSSLTKLGYGMWWLFSGKKVYKENRGLFNS